MKLFGGADANRSANFLSVRWPLVTLVISWVLLQWGPDLCKATPTLSSSRPHRSGIADNEHLVHHHSPHRNRSQEPAVGLQHSAISRVLHQVFLSRDPKNLTSVASKDLGAVYANWREACQEIHFDWEYRFWDDEAADDLVRTRYKSFLPAWEAYDRPIMRSDAIRPMILHAFGGLYLDLDTECYKRADPFLKSYSLVFQREMNNPPEEAPKLNNGVIVLQANTIYIMQAMASAPGHPYWEYLLGIMAERAPIKDQGPWGLKDLKEDDWQLNLLWKTGPICLAESFAKWREESGHTGGVSMTHATGTVDMDWWRTYHIYNVGEFYFPCNWDNPQYCKEVEAMAFKPEKTAGMHHFSASWVEKPFV